MLLVWLFCGTQGCYCIQVQELVQGLRCSLAWIRTLRRVLNLSYVWDTNPWSRFSKHVCPAKSASRFVVAPFYVPDVSARCDALSTSYFFSHVLSVWSGLVCSVHTKPWTERCGNHRTQARMETEGLSDLRLFNMCVCYVGEPTPQLASTCNCSGVNQKEGVVSTWNCMDTLM